MNLKELHHHLNNERDIVIGERKLQRVVNLGKLKPLRQYGTEDIEEIVKAIETINQGGGTADAYRDAERMLDGDESPFSGMNDKPRLKSSAPSPADSRPAAAPPAANKNNNSSSHTASNSRHETLNTVLDETIGSFVEGIVRQKASEFLNSDDGFEFIANIVTEEFVEAGNKSFETWKENDLRKMRNVTPRTLEIEGQTVQDAPLHSASEPATDGADFHSYTETDSDNPDENGGQHR